MANNTNSRTLVPAIIPPGAAHIHGVTSLGLVDGDADRTLLIAGVLSSLLADFTVRIAPKSTISGATVGRIPVEEEFALADMIESRALVLNSLTEAYSELWEKSSLSANKELEWTGGYSCSPSVSVDVLGAEWTRKSPLRLDADRRRALVEIDALVALMLGVTVDELCSIYRTQFPVLYKYDTQRDHYDQNGRLVPAEVLKAWQKFGDSATEDDLTATNAQGFTYTYAPPFATLDREADMRTAYAEFELRLADREGNSRDSRQGAAS